MGNMVLSPQRIRQCMYRCSSGGRDRRTRVKCGSQHIRFRFLCFGLFTCRFYISKNQPRSLLCKQIAEWICLIGCKTFYRMRHCVDSCRCRNFFREIRKEAAVQNHVIRHHFPIHDTYFQLLFRYRHNTVHRSLRSGSRSRGNHKDRDTFSSQPRIFQQLPYRYRSVRCNRSQFRHIHDATAACGNNQISTGPAEPVDCLLGLITIRFSRQIRQHNGLYPRLMQQLYRGP